MNKIRLCLKLVLICALSSAILFHPAFAKDDQSSLVRIPYKGPSQIRNLEQREIRVVRWSPKGYLDVAAFPRDIDYLVTEGYPVSILASPGMALAAPALDGNLGSYHTYAEMESTLLALELEYPSLASVDIIGTSHEGRSIYSLKISDNVTVDESEPEVLIMGNHHARELMSVEIPLLFTVYLLENYGTDPAVSALVDGREIFIVPMVNPDGHVYVELNHGSSWWNWWRKNRRDNGDGFFGVDLNRNYGYKWGFDDLGSSPVTYSDLYRGPSAFSEPETQTIRDFVTNRSFTLGFSYHSYGELLLYPWGYKAAYTADHSLFYALGDTLASSNGYYQGNTAMGAIYVTNGGSDDWAYGDHVNKYPFFCFTPEVNTSAQGGFGPPDTLIAPTFDLLLPMNMLLLELADNPHKLLGPYAPSIYPIDGSPWGSHIVRWSSNDPSDPNPAVEYDLIEYKNFFTAEDHADTLSDLWEFDGFALDTKSYEGTGSYYSKSFDNLSHTLATRTSFPVTIDNDSLVCRVWYDIESDWDYAYVEVNTGDGLVWEPIPGNITTDYNPNGSNHGNGITGSSGGWIEAIFPLTSYIGRDIVLRFHYITDASVYGEGFYVDLLNQVPVYETVAFAGTAIPDTFLAITPLSTGQYTYKVRARDAEGHGSFWSGSVSYTVDEIVGVDDTPSAPTGLGQNYPNPFNPTTTIPYYVGGDRAAFVETNLAIYSVDGARITTLVDGTRQPGAYQARWNGTDDSGNALSSGIYFARLKVGTSPAVTRKLVLLK